MSLQDWHDNGWLRKHQSSEKEIAGLLSIVDRDLDDATTSELSSDWKFGIAYNAALKLCTMLLHASGYRPEKELQHFRTLAALPLILGPERAEQAKYLDACRKKRNTVEYDVAGVTSDTEAAELVKYAKELRKDVLAWLKTNHPDLVP
ncbi:MAG: hypothetical protein NTW87_02985 [Planctomycetota bacterium]|nr:hypothetical protein [Planctomycetota bacterium]